MQNVLDTIYYKQPWIDTLLYKSVMILTALAAKWIALM